MGGGLESVHPIRVQKFEIGDLQADGHDRYSINCEARDGRVANPAESILQIEVDSISAALCRDAKKSLTTKERRAGQRNRDAREHGGYPRCLSPAAYGGGDRAIKPSQHQ